MYALRATGPRRAARGSVALGTYVAASSRGPPPRLSHRAWMGPHPLLVRLGGKE